jgi:hypothetical protein
VACFARGGPARIERLDVSGVRGRRCKQCRGRRVDRVISATNKAIDFEQIHMLQVDATGFLRHDAVRDDMTMLRLLGAFVRSARRRPARREAERSVGPRGPDGLRSRSRSRSRSR